MVFLSSFYRDENEYVVHSLLKKPIILYCLYVSCLVECIFLINII